LAALKDAWVFDKEPWPLLMLISIYAGCSFVFLGCRAVLGPFLSEHFHLKSSITRLAIVVIDSLHSSQLQLLTIVGFLRKIIIIITLTTKRDQDPKQNPFYFIDDGDAELRLRIID
jgi:hypothetical protein